MAVRKVNKATVAALIQAGADVNACDDVRAVHAALVTALSRHSACPQDGWTPLFYAAFHDRKEPVQLLLSHGARASVKNRVSKQVAGHRIPAHM